MKKIVNVGWSIGNFCNAKCNHCYSWKSRKESIDMLTNTEINIILDKLISYGVETVNFGGNEPIFTHGADVAKTKLPYIIETLYKHNVACGITTNGYTALYLYENHPNVFHMINDWDFSLDAPCREDHDQNRNMEGAFNNVLKGLELCTRFNRPKSIVIAGMISNLDTNTLKDFIDLAREYSAELRINLLKPIEEHHFKMFPDAGQVYKAFQYLFDETELITLSEPFLACQAGIEMIGCPCGEYSFRIRSKQNGRVPITPCVYMELDGGDLLTQSIEEIVESNAFVEFCKRKNDIPHECREMECEYLKICRGGCTARSFLMYGNYDSKDPYCPVAVVDVANKYLKGHSLEKIEDGSIRVHENYLCTWIGKPVKKGGN